MMNRLFLNLLTAGAALASLPGSAWADDFSGSFNGSSGGYHEVYHYRDYNHYRFRCAPNGCFAISPGSAAYRYNTTAPTGNENRFRQVQSALRQRGYYHGDIDGAIGPASRAAIRSYQSDRNLPVSGTVDSSLLHSLELVQK